MLSLQDLIASAGGEVIVRAREEFSGVSIDSRTISGDELFFALRGERHDGHSYLRDVLQKGGGAVIARGCDLSSLPHLPANKTVVAVDDPLTALQAWARALRFRFPHEVIGVVGSNGKTTTKELIASVLAVRFAAHKTAGNMNNHIGLPLSLLRKPDAAQIMIMEMGTNRPGDIRELCEIAGPSIGVVTNIGMEHLAGFGSLERVREAELEILPYVHTAIVNADDRFLMDGVKSSFHGKILSFAIDNRDADIRASRIEPTASGTRFVVHLGPESATVDLQLCGRFNVANALAAVAAGSAAGMMLQEIRSGLESFAGVHMRFSVVRHEGITILSDVYNANPSSMDAAVDELVRRCREESGSGRCRMVAVLGNMLELGEREAELHANLGRRLKAEGVEVFIGVGSLMRHAVEAFGPHAEAVEDAPAAARMLMPRLRPGDCLLVKGSRGMRMERFCEELGIEAGKK